jgi:hypothetical protein
VPAADSWAAAEAYEAYMGRWVEGGALDRVVDCARFDDDWRPFLGGTGPAPAYLASLSPEARSRPRDWLIQRFLPAADGPLRMRTRALAVRGLVP